ncbi:hypothetical protein DCAR_0100469 [Daucus carota subsp. sativus]|uniref:Uncharacterized protein n=1 Tax=Daucus carota subsp. sativus TaxID=79200 RepID=A0A166FP41_DAUCS|nr:hypothetical protein DCAR_0100469 [Daucus carota subsp. sativus]
MALQQKTTSTLDLVPLLAVMLIAAHVLALVYWVYRLATERQQVPRKKKH